MVVYYMSKYAYNTGKNNNNKNSQSHVIKRSIKTPSINSGDFSRRPPHTPPKGSGTSSKGKNNK